MRTGMFDVCVCRWRWWWSGRFSSSSPGETPPGQGGIEILARDDVDVPLIMQLVFQHSKSYVFFAAIQFPRQSAGHSSCATEGRFHSAVLEQGRRHPCSRFPNSGGASDSVIGRSQ